MTENAEAKPGTKSRLKEELWKFGLVSAYLFVCFLVIELFRSSILAEQHLQSWKMGFAIGEALIIGKFILLGQAAKIGTRISARTVWHRIVLKSFLFWLTLIVLTVLEEIIVGWAHDRSFTQTLHVYLDRSFIENIAPTLVMLLILIPLIAFNELNRALGEGVLRSILLSGEKPQSGE